MDLSESEFGIFEKEILTAASAFNFDLENLAVEFFSPGRQGIFVETVGARVFRIHVNLEEGRIIAVKQIAGPPVPEGEASDPFAKYKIFMK